MSKINFKTADAILAAHLSVPAGEAFTLLILRTLWRWEILPHRLHKHLQKPFEDQADAQIRYSEDWPFRAVRPVRLSYIFDPDTRPKGEEWLTYPPCAGGSAANDTGRAA